MARTLPAADQTLYPAQIKSGNCAEEKPSAAPSAKTACAPASDDESGAVILTTAELEPLEYPSESSVCVAIHDLEDESNWLHRHEAITTLRQTIVHHPELMVDEYTYAILPALAAACDNLRSALSKNALFALGECFENLPHACLIHLASCNQKRQAVMIDVLLRRATCEKRFLRDAALIAVDKLIHHLASPELIASVSSYASSKNAKIVAIASRIMAQSFSRLKDLPHWDAEQFVSGHENCSVYQALAKFRVGKESTARIESMSCLRLLGLSLGREKFEAVLAIALSDQRHNVESIVAEVFPPLGGAPSISRRGSLKDRVLLQQK